MYNIMNKYIKKIKSRKWNPSKKLETWNNLAAKEISIKKREKNRLLAIKVEVKP